ncbi:uncharacterized protein LOC130015239 [Mercurialis annua]|uniref:uncharacterized protein LOC130015239 n=1 Tax=Mercurialis annua TaxID=3986 RepID=UPI0024AD019A|nr:uncharacterized protein LOC130015239 [Mercurialis annua]
MGKKRAGRKPESSSSVLDSGSDTSDRETVGNEAISRHPDDVVPAAETTGAVESSHVDNSEVDLSQQIPNVDVNETVAQPSVLDIAREAVESLRRSPRPTLTKAMIIESRLKSAAAANVKQTPEAKVVQSDSQQTVEPLVNPAGRSSKRSKKGGASSIVAEMAKLKASYAGKKTVKHVSFEIAKNDSHVEEATAPVKEVKKKPPVAAKRKVVFESTADDKGADKIAKKSPKSPIKKKTDKSNAGAKRKASAEPSELEEVLAETTIKSAKTRSASASSKKKPSTATHEPEKVLNDASKEMWSLRWKLEEIPTTRVDHCMKHKVVDKLKSHLTDSQLEMFRATCFGFVLDMPSCNFQGQVVHSMLARQFDNAGENEMWFAVGQLKVRFSIEEFAILTGLNCTGEIQKVGFEDGANHFAEKYFGGLSKLNRQSVAECFACKRWQSDEDAVKIAFLYVLELYFLCALDSNLIEAHHLDVIASEDYNSYPWGKEIFYYTLKSFKSKDLTKKFKNEGYCRLLGFPIILQFLFYECFPTVDGKICTLVGNKVPRCLNWSSSITPTVDDLQSNFYNQGSEILAFLNI